MLLSIYVFPYLLVLHLCDIMILMMRIIVERKSSSCSYSDVGMCFGVWVS